MLNCTRHQVCAGGPIRGDEDLSLALACMMQRGILETRQGKLCLTKTAQWERYERIRGREA